LVVAVAALAGRVIGQAPATVVPGEIAPVAAIVRAGIVRAETGARGPIGLHAARNRPPEESPPRWALRIAVLRLRPMPLALKARAVLRASVSTASIAIALSGGTDVRLRRRIVGISREGMARVTVVARERVAMVVTATGTAVVRERTAMVGTPVTDGMLRAVGTVVVRRVDARKETVGARATGVVRGRIAVLRRDIRRFGEGHCPG
jgi:hypothetical protein